MSREELNNLYTKSSLIRLVLALEKVCNYQQGYIKRLQREIYNPLSDKRKYSDKDINKFLGYKPIN